MPQQISILNQSQLRVPPQQRLRKVLAQLCATLATGVKSVELLFLDDEGIQTYYRQYFGEDRPTDVIAFPMEDDEILGAIVISIPTAKKQAKEHKQSLWNEIRFLMIHGFLHLLGYDHAEPDEKQVMQAKEQELLQLTQSI